MVSQETERKKERKKERHQRISISLSPNKCFLENQVSNFSRDMLSYHGVKVQEKQQRLFSETL